MGLKEFFRPTKKKIILLFIFVLISVIYSLYLYLYLSSPLDTYKILHPLTQAAIFILFSFFIILFKFDIINDFLLLFGYFITLILQILLFYLISCALSRLWNRKKYYRFSVILIFIILIIPLFLPYKLGGGLPEPKTEIFQTAKDCNVLCQNVGWAIQDIKADAIWEYCTYTTALSKTDYAKVINKNLGENIFCRDKTYCFNLPEAQCKVENKTITPKYCLETMCKVLINAGLTRAQAEQRIKERMLSGSCNLRQGAKIKVNGEEKEILVLTWWEKYFENPDCSEFVE